MLRMDEFNKIRKEFFVNKKSIYQIAQEYNRSWATITNIVKIPEYQIESRGKRNKKNHVITPEVLNRINDFLEFEVSHKVPKKQRFTANFIFKKVRDESDYKERNSLVNFPRMYIFKIELYSFVPLQK